MSYPGAEFDAESAGLLSPPDYVNPDPADRYHLAIVGAGSAGLICAIGAAGLGAQVALVERHRMGGDCLNVGCVPSKALLEYSRVHPGDFDGAFEHLRKVRASIAPHDSVERYSEAGVDVFLGEAAFTAAGTLMLGDVEIQARRYAICTGARADIPPIPGLAQADPLTNETLFDLESQPQSLAILGAGAIGCEMALAFSRLGVEVHLFELALRVLPLEIEEASEAVAAALARSGVHIHTGHGVTEVLKGPRHIVSNGEIEVEVEQILVALGRRPNTEGLNLDAVGVGVDERGFVVTDEKLRTANKRVFSAGDCTAREQFTHHADAQARALIQNALFFPTARVDGLIVPHCTYTKPEVASVGPNQEDLDAAGTAYDVLEFRFDELDRGRAELDGEGFARVYLKKGSDEILAATIVGHDAGEQIAMICMLMSNGLGLSAAGKTIFSYPTRAEYIKRLSDAYNRTRLTPAVSRLFDSWLKIVR